MGNKNVKIAFIILITFFPFSHILTQNFYFPVAGESADNFSSAFGPRNKGSQNYPNIGYDYDFHAAIDIAAPVGEIIYPVTDGIVEKINNSNSDNEYIIIKHEDSYGPFLVKYLHVDVNTNLNNGDTVIGGSTIIGTVRNYSSGGSHLDIRFFPYISSWLDIFFFDANADNPGKILVGTNYTNLPIPLDENGNELSWNSQSLLHTQRDYHVGQGNPAGAAYFQIGIRVYDDELDFENLEIFLLGTDGINFYNQDELLNNNSFPTFPSVVDYLNRINCGDTYINDDDIGYNSSSVGIYPKMFSQNDPYHTVYFRWYVNENLWYGMSSIIADIWG